MSAPHTAEQISALWVLYHSSRSGGTGRGYLSASIPKETHEKMVERGRKYPIFVLPLPRAVPKENEDGSKEEVEATEFYYMEWAFHSPPEAPSPLTNLDPVDAALATPPPPSTPSESLPLPPVATILFTPLEEYKLRLSYAQPRLIITLYPDFTHTHNLVLLRGEISPSESNPQAFTMSQMDAQLLAMAVQKFYIPSDAEVSRSAAELLDIFHTRPGDFDYEKLIEVGKTGL